MYIMFVCISIMLESIPAITISGNTTLRLEEKSRLKCSTPFPVESIQWLDQSNRVVREEMPAQELVLELSATAFHHNSRYSCRVRINGQFVDSRSIFIQVEGTYQLNFDQTKHFTGFSCENLKPQLITIL